MLRYMLAGMIMGASLSGIADSIINEVGFGIASRFMAIFVFSIVLLYVDLKEKPKRDNT